MKTKQIFLIISMLLVFTFTACSNNAATPNNNTTPAPNNSTEDTGTPDTDAENNNTPDSADSTPELRPALTERQLKITLNDEDVIYAKLADSHATNIFIEGYVRRVY